MYTVLEGRDIGTVVFPDAEFKFFLTASAKERAKRRFKELKEKGEVTVTLDDVEKEIIARDLADQPREISPLKKASDAIEVDTDNNTAIQVVEILLNYVQKSRGNS